MCLESFTIQLSANSNLLQWIALNSLLSAASWAHVYTFRLFATNAQKLKNPLNITLYELVESDDVYPKCDKPEDNLCGLVWVKLVFFIGFGFSQYSMGFLADKFGPYQVLKIVIKLLIMSGIAATLSSNIYVFCTMWFMVAYTCTAVFLLSISQVLEQLDEKTNSWKWRLFIGSSYQMSWILGRCMSHFIIYILNDWVDVMLTVTLILTCLLFALEKQIWTKEFTYRQRYSNPVKALVKTKGSNVLNIILLSLTWFVLGFNYYGNMNNFDNNVADSNKTFEHFLLQTLLAIVAKMLALFICLFVHRKCFPMTFIQVMLAITYFVLLAYDPEHIDKTETNSLFSPVNILMFLTHLTTFWVSASFELIWIITPETFPREYR